MDQSIGEGVTVERGIDSSTELSPFGLRLFNYWRVLSSLTLLFLASTDGSGRVCNLVGSGVLVWDTHPAASFPINVYSQSAPQSLGLFKA